MKHRVKITVMDTKCFSEYQQKYLADPASGPCPVFHKGDVYLFDRTADKDDFYHMGLNTLVHTDCNPEETAGGSKRPFCSEAWDAISRYIYTGLQGGSIMHGWTNDDRMMITCCNDGTRPVIFRLERIDIPETKEEEEWLAKQDFSNHKDDAYTG